MKNLVGIIITLFLSCVWLTAQTKVVLHSPKQQHIETHLYDEDDNFLLTLPLTFSITDKNILVMMVGNDVKLSGGQTVWMFSEETYLSDLTKSNRNVSATKSFKNRNTKMNTVLIPHRRITLHRAFDDGCEIIKNNAKPVFINLNDSSSNPQTFYLQFYVAKSDNKYPSVFIAKCKPIEIELIK